LFLQALLDPGYRGRIYPVNPNAREILGLPCYPSVTSLPEAVDLAIIVVPAGVVTSVSQMGATPDGRNVVVITEANSLQRIDYAYDRATGLLVALTRTDAPLSMQTKLRLTNRR